MKDKFYITTTLPYINSEPHIGFAAEIIKADVIARHARQKGKEVFFNTGTDEHGLKIFQKAQEEGLSVTEFCDKTSAKFLPLKEKLNLSYTNFIRTTSEGHKKAVQEFWNRCLANGDIYKKNYEVKYCVGCELEKTDSDLVDGFCPYHPGKELEIINEENYFFKFSAYSDKLKDLYNSNPNFVKPESRFKEIKSFVDQGLKDFSISRLKEKMPHGITVPGDDTQVIYVWFDALVSYISALNWPSNEEKFNDFWPGLQVCGKDNLRQQSAMWQAMLMSAGLKNSKQVLVFGFLTVDGQKISKSAGTAVNPLELVDTFGTDALRYYLLAEIATFEDGDYSFGKISDRYNSDLANGLGNLSSRVSNLFEKNEIKTKLSINAELLGNTYVKFEEAFDKYHFNECLQIIWAKLKECDEILSEKTPWKLTDREEIASIIIPIAQNILNLAHLIEPFIPESAEKIIKCFSSDEIKKIEPLFPRLEINK